MHSTFNMTGEFGIELRILRCVDVLLEHVCVAVLLDDHDALCIGRIGKGLESHGAISRTDDGCIVGQQIVHRFLMSTQHTKAGDQVHVFLLRSSAASVLMAHLCQAQPQASPRLTSPTWARSEILTVRQAPKTRSRLDSRPGHPIATRTQLHSTDPREHTN